ncbi:hypothetical protein KAR91_42810 [Candidatus Pacearchaeota archaeon]|nr:hypothetical protein [Candidatus Pacearchaeota archaeon]
MTPHFQDTVKDSLSSIERDGRWLETHGWPKVWAWVQRKAGSKAHPEGIAHTLEQVRSATGVKNYWSYAEQVYKIRGPHFFEQEWQEKAEIEKMEWVSLVNDLKALHGKKDTVR